MTKYYRVKIGYGKDDFIQITEEELGKALRAQGRGTIAILGDSSIAGNHIMAIIPDYQRELGYNREYILTGEDYAQIGKKRMREYTDLLLETTRSEALLPPLKEQKRLT